MRLTKIQSGLLFALVTQGHAFVCVGPSMNCRSQQSHTSAMTSFEFPKKISKVAIIGAGAAGLAAAKELRKEFKVQIIEQANDVGGTWLYTDDMEEDCVLKPSESKSWEHTKVHSSMYRSLRTNLPREVMQYSDFPFSSDFSELRYPSHTAVLEYIRSFAEHNRLFDVISFGRKVTKIRPSSISESGIPVSWSVRHCDAESHHCQEDTFDAVMVCNGHYSVPYIPDIPGAADFPGLSMHSHNYREPSRFAGLRVLIIGASNSGEDLSREVSLVAQRVLLSARGFPDTADARSGYGTQRNIFRVPEVSRLRADGTAEWVEGGGAAVVDAIIYCTGYRYAFPFLEEEFFSIKDNAIIPLYKHMLPPGAPNLALIGLPAKIIPFPQFELQAKYAAAVWSGRARLPPTAEMLAEVQAEVDAKEAQGRAMRHFHIQGGEQFAYNEELARLSGAPRPERWRQAMYEQSGINKRLYPDSYRDRPLPTIAEYNAMLGGSEYGAMLGEDAATAGAGGGSGAAAQARL